MMTLMVDNFFSLMRKDDPMSTQFEYGTRRAARVRELQKRMYRDQFHYYTGPSSYYHDKVIDACPPKSEIVQITEVLEELSLEDKATLREFASSFGKRVRQHTIRDKSKEETGHLPYAISFCTQTSLPGSTVPTASLLGETLQSTAEGDNSLDQSRYEVGAISYAGCCCCETC